MVQANKALSDVTDPGRAFWFCNGTIVRNIYELASTVELCNNEIFEYHNNSEKNDFYKWVLDVLGDNVLARRIKKEQDKKKFFQKIKRRIKELEKL